MTPRVYPGIVLDVHDGDTLHVSLDAGLHVWVHCDVRLLGINAQELAQPGGPEARDHLAGLVPTGTVVVVTITGPDKYGARWLGHVAAAGIDVAQRMVTDGWAAPWNGKGSKPVPPFPPP